MLLLDRTSAPQTSGRNIDRIPRGGGVNPMVHVDSRFSSRVDCRRRLLACGRARPLDRRQVEECSTVSDILSQSLREL